MKVNKTIKLLLVVALIIFCQNPIYGIDMEKDILITLPPPDTKGKLPLETAIEKRRSVRSFKKTPLTLSQIGQLLWSAQGLTSKEGFRAAPSAGALYPLELYVLYQDGLFHYIPKGHKLRKISSKDLRPGLQLAALFQGSVGSAAADIIICAEYERVGTKYGERGVRYTHIEVGHAAENILLQAVALGLASVPIGAFNDKAVSQLLSLPESEVPLYIIAIGYKR